MAFGVAGLLATIGLIVAAIAGTPELPGLIGYVYASLVFVGVTLPCLIIGNYVDDMRKNAVIAQMGYSLVAMALASLFLFVRGVHYVWTVPLFQMAIYLAVSNLAMFIVFTQAAIVLYLVFSWNRVIPPEGVEVIRDRGKARRIEQNLVPIPLSPSMIHPDGETELSPDDSLHVLEATRVVTEEGMAILCSNCGGATPLTKVQDDNKLQCDYCGVTLGLSSVFVPCENHPEYLAATTCSVCGKHFCRKCLTAQEPPIDSRWEGEVIFLCQKCFEGRYRPAVTTTSFVIPIHELFSKAGSRFHTVGRIYGRFLGAYGGILKHLWRIPLELLANIGKSGGGGGNDNCVGALLLVIIMIVAIPILAGLLLLIGAIIIIPLLFYAGLIAVTYEAVKVIRKTDFQSLDTVRIQSIIQKKKPKIKESRLRPATRSWEEDHALRPLYAQRVQDYEERHRRLREEELRRQQRKRSERSYWGERY